MLITVFTPTYNRSELLKNVYHSLLQQTFVNFEWIIVDDGSTDNTEQIVQTFIKDEKIEISYLKQLNRGKHIAINNGVNEAKGTYFFIVDSDDFLPENALSILNEKILVAQDLNNIGGVVGRKMFINKQQIGSKFSSDIISDSVEIRYKYKITGDLAEVFKTSVLKEFPFPEIENEKFCPEALVWNRIAQKYQLLFFKESIYIADYLPDGLTHRIVKIRMQSPMASMLHYAELSSYKVPIQVKLKSAINFWRFSCNASIPFKEKINLLNHFFYLSMLPLGFLMYLKDKRK